PRGAAPDGVVCAREALASRGDGSTAPEGLYTIVQGARAKWSHGPELPRAVQEELATRYHQALGRLVALWPSAFGGTDLDPELTRKRMEKLVARIEELVPSQARST